MFKCCQQILGLEIKRPNVDDARKAFLTLSRILHPDKVKPGHPEESLMKAAYDSVRAAWDKAQAVAPKGKKGKKK